MSIALITSDLVFRKTIEKALKKTGLQIEVHASMSTLKNFEEDTLFLLDSSIVDFKKLNNLPLALWVFEKKEHSISDDKRTQFDEIFETPFRLGNFVDTLTAYISSRSRKLAMKTLVLGDYEFDPKSGIFKNKTRDKEVKLTEKEQDILIYLYKSKATKVSRDKLLEEVWKYASGVETHTLETHIYRLRQKIEDDPSQPVFLVTDDEGYYLNF